MERTRGLVGAVGVVLALAGCASAAPPGMVDYDPVDSLAGLAASSSVVVQGRIERIQAGRTTIDVAPWGPGSQVSSVIVVSDVMVEAGSLEPASDGYVYIEFAPEGTTAACTAALPDDTRVVAYLKPAWDGVATSVEADIVTELTDPDAGRPAGQALYSAAALEGLVWQPPGSPELIWPLYLGAGTGDIRDTLPDGTLAGPR